MNEITIKPECLEHCNSMRHLESSEQRQEFVDQCAINGLLMQCHGPRPGLKHPICGLPEPTKRATEEIVRPVMRARALVVAGIEV